MNKPSIMLLVVVILSLSCASKNKSGKEELSLHQENPKQDKRSADLVLREYLFARSTGEYEKCLDFLSQAFLSKFVQRFGTDYVDYYRNQNEDYYKNPNILSVNKLDNGLISISVTVEIEGPGYKLEALETYFMAKDMDGWRIHDWKIEYKE